MQGNWREEQFYLLEDCYQNYQHYKERIASCDNAIEKQLQHYHKELFPTAAVDVNTVSSKKPTKNKPKFNTCSYFKAILGADVAAIFGISDISALEILSDGNRYDKMGNVKAFCVVAQPMSKQLNIGR